VSAIASAIALPESWGAAGQAVSDFRAEFVGFEHDVAHLLDDLDVLRRQLYTRTRELEREKLRLSEREADFERQRDDANRLALQLEHQEADLAAAKQDLAEVRAQLEQHSHGAGRGEGSEDTRLAEVHAELEQALLELELVRGHAAELQDTVAEQKQELSEQRSTMGDELKQLRRLVEQQAEMLAQQPADSASAALAAVAPAPPAKDASAAADPVVSSVMAQFAKLQQDVAQRRKSRK
jgi:chromosome segregation ATPase